MKNNNSKEVCILDENNYFIGTKILYRDPKNKERIEDSINSYDIPKPNLKFILDNIKAKWNFDNEEWIYEDNKPSKPFKSEELNPMYYFRLARKRRLEYIEKYVLAKIQSGTFTYPTKLKKYKQDIYELPLRIENGEIEPPAINEDLEKYNKTKDPEDMIIFDWPTFAFKV